MLQLRPQKIDGDRQPGRREDLLGKMFENGLRRHPLGEPFAQGPEEVRLFDVLFAIQHRGERECHGMILRRAV